MDGKEKENEKQKGERRGRVKNNRIVIQNDNVKIKSIRGER